MPVFETKIKHRLADYEGVVPSDQIRMFFEHLINMTPKLAGTVCLDRIEIAGVEEYADEATRTLFFGFGMGMRCAERIAKTHEVTVVTK